MSSKLQQELSILENAIESPTRPFALLVGGNRCEKKLNIIRKLLPTVDKVIVGGLISHLFHKANNPLIGDLDMPEEAVVLAKQIIEESAQLCVPIILADDVAITPTSLLYSSQRLLHSVSNLHQHNQTQAPNVITAESKKGAQIDIHSFSPLRPGRTTKSVEQALLAEGRHEQQRAATHKPFAEATQPADAEARQCAYDEIPAGWMPVDIGEKSVQKFCQELRGCSAVLWIGNYSQYW